MPATDEVWRLQRGTDPECIFFQQMAEQGHYGGRPGASRQGIYVCAPSGAFLASINSNSADRVLATMKQGLEAWNNLPQDQRRLSDNAEIKPKHRWEDSYPEDGLVLTMYTRDLPDGGGPEQRRDDDWNQDRVWFSKAEARALLPTDIRQGSKHQLPMALLNRLARFHLVDTVRGQTTVFSVEEVASSKISVEITSVRDSIVKIEITGKTHAESSHRNRRRPLHGVASHILGTGVYNLEQKQFTEFEMVALGTRWGYTTFNGRRRGVPEGPIGFVFKLAGPDEPRIAPAFADNYYTDWVKRPGASK